LRGNLNWLRGDERRCYHDWRCHVNDRPDHVTDNWGSVVTEVAAIVTTVTATAATGETGVGRNDDDGKGE
jgi:hypothetical protein